MSAASIVQEAPSKVEAEPTLKRDFVWTFAGNAIYAAAQWAVVAFLAKSGTADLVGRYAFAVAVATPVITFANLQLRSVQASDLQGQFEFAEYLRFRLLTIFGALIFLAVLCLAMRFEWQTSLLIAAVGVSLSVEAVSDVYYGVMQLHLKMDRIAISMILRALLSLGGLAAGLYLTHKLLYGVLGITLARTLTLAVYDLRTGSSGLRGVEGSLWKSLWVTRARWHVGTTGALLRLAFPVGFVAVLLSLNTYVPRYFIKWSAGTSELGIFSALSFFQSSGNMISGALGQAAFVRLAKEYKKTSIRPFITLLSRLLFAGLALGLGGVLVAAVAGRQILTVLYRPEYGTRADLLVYLMIATALGYPAQFVGYAVTSARMFNPQMPLCFVVSCSLVLACYLLVPSYGLTGAVWAIIVAMAVQLLGYLLLLTVGLRRHRVLAAA